MKFVTKKVNDVRVLGRIATSWGLLLIMIVAPFCWGLLPIGYGILNANAEIKANPYFTVFMRMLTSFCLTAILALGVWLWFGVLNKKSKKGFRDLCGQTLIAVKSRLIWLILLFVCYFGARAIEMRCILTFTVGEEHDATASEKCREKAIAQREAFAEEYGEQQRRNPYLKGGFKKVKKPDGTVFDMIPVVEPVKNLELPDPKSSEPPREPKQNAVESRTTKALQDYGYFMGLMLALMLAIKNNSVYGLLAKLSARKFPALSKNLFGLCCGSLPFVGKIFWAGTLFLTIASGILYIAAKEPLYVWPYVASMTGIACFVALLTSFGTDCKMLGNVKVDGGIEGCPTWTPALVASIIVNLFQSGGTALLAVVVWRFSRSTWSGFGHLFSQYYAGWNWIALVVLVGVLGSVVAPVSQLFGVNLHDAKLKRIGMSRYGVTGGNWLMICGGFEPLFVVLIGLAIPMVGGTLVSLCPMLIAVATVAVIALLKIAEVWSEKNSVVRNAIFTKVRGSTQDSHADLTDAELRDRAVQLSFLKFYDKRRELAAYATSLTSPMALDACNLSLGQSYPDVYLSFIENGQHYFAQDDPFTNTVLRAQELYLERCFADVKIISLKRFLVNGGRISFEDWTSKVRPAARKWATDSGIVGDDAMPYVIISNDEKKVARCAAQWSDLLQEISKAVQSGELDAYVNGMIVQFEE